MNVPGAGTEATATRPASRRRRLLEVTFWVLAVAAAWGLSTLVKWQEGVRSGQEVDMFRLLAEQGTSAGAALAMIPLVVHWLRRFPIGSRHWLLAHLAGSGLFTLGHFSLMILLRSTVFAARGMTYHWQAGALGNLLFEYQKDIGIYLAIVALLSAYRLWLRHRGPAVGKPAPALVVQSGTGELPLEIAAIDYLESARNYVSVFAGGREYLMRETMNSLEQRLVEQGFARCHRSYLVRLGAVAELCGGDGRQKLRLHCGAEIPLGRSYKKSFRAQFTRGELPPLTQRRAE